MNKGISLAIVGVLLCAMGIIFFMSLSADKDEKRFTQTPQETILPDQPAETGQNDIPLIAGKDAGQERVIPTIPPQTTSRPDQTKVTPPPVTTPPVKKIEPATAPSEKKAAPPTQKTAKQPVQPESSQTKPATPPAKTETSSKPETPPVKTQTPQQEQTKAPSLKPLESATASQEKTPPATVAQAAKNEHTLSKIGLHFRGNDIYLRIEADSAFKEEVFTLPSPDRLVVDLVGKWKNVTAPVIPSNQLVTKARIGQQPNATRLVLDLSRGTKFTVLKVSDTVVEILMQ